MRSAALLIDTFCLDAIKALFLVALVDSIWRPRSLRSHAAKSCGCELPTCEDCIDDPTRLPRAIQRWWRRPR